MDRQPRHPGLLAEVLHHLPDVPVDVVGGGLSSRAAVASVVEEEHIAPHGGVERHPAARTDDAVWLVETSVSVRFLLNRFSVWCGMVWYGTLRFGFGWARCRPMRFIWWSVPVGFGSLVCGVGGCGRPQQDLEEGYTTAMQALVPMTPHEDNTTHSPDT